MSAFLIKKSMKPPLYTERIKCTAPIKSHNQSYVNQNYTQHLNTNQQKHIAKSTPKTACPQVYSKRRAGPFPSCLFVIFQEFQSELRELNEAGMPFSLTPLDAAALDRIFQEERSRSPSARTRFRFSGTGGECCSPRGSFFLRNLNYIKLLSSLFLYAPPGGRWPERLCPCFRSFPSS